MTNKPATLFGVSPESARPRLEMSVAAHEPADAVLEDEATVLRRLLADQRAATLEARAQAADLQKLLSEAGGTMKTGADAHTGRDLTTELKPPLAPDAAMIKVQWERAQKDLQRSQLARKRESEQAKAKLAIAQDALTNATDARSQDSRVMERQFRLRILAGLTALVAVAAIGFFIVTYREAPPESSTVLTPALPHPTTREPAAPPDFSQGVGRLSRAFNRFPDAEPEALMLAVNKRAPAKGPVPCAFAWNDGEPELQFGDRHGEKGSLMETLSRCAAAVEQFR